MTVRKRGFPETNFQHFLNNPRIDGDLHITGDLTVDGEAPSGGSQTVFVQDEDPGAVGAGMIWVEPSTPQVFVRNNADDGWQALYVTDFNKTFDTGGGEIDTDGGSLVLGGGGLDMTAGGGITMAAGSTCQVAKLKVTERIGFYGTTPVVQQQVPATGGLTAQDVVDVLITLGLITQAS